MLDEQLARIFADHGADGGFRVLSTLMTHGQRGLSAVGFAKVQAALIGFASR